ncbi:unnamed protein product, partial [Allacma fusca]
MLHGRQMTKRRIL